MSTVWERTTAIVDYGMGNLYSVARGCEAVGMPACITSDPDDVLRAQAVILPGVGAMPHAMSALVQGGLDVSLRAVVAEGKPFFGICLGMQLLMEEGTEFGPHRGLGILPGRVERISWTNEAGGALRVPHIGWNTIQPPQGRQEPWAGTPLEAVRSAEYFYFVHSYVVVPKDPAVVAATTSYGGGSFCAALRVDNLFACQFHPERSGSAGLAMLQWFARELIANPQGHTRSRATA